MWLAAARVLDIHPPSDTDHHPEARAVVSVQAAPGHAVFQQVREDVETVRNIVNQATGLV